MLRAAMLLFVVVLTACSASPPVADLSEPTPSAVEPAPSPSPADGPVPASDGTVACESEELGFRNPAVGFSVCYPEGWGFIDLQARGPSAQVPAEQLGWLRLGSPALFPWDVGDSETTALERKGGGSITLAAVIGDPDDACQLRRVLDTDGQRTRMCAERVSLGEEGITPDQQGRFEHRMAVIDLPAPLRRGSGPPDTHLFLSGLLERREIDRLGDAWDRILSSIRFSD